MSSQRRIDANRKNAELSTGPKTEEGKAVSRANAVSHGLSGEGVVVTPEEALLLEERMTAWRSSFKNELEDGNLAREFLFRQVVLNSIRIKAAQRREFEIHHAQKQNAIHNWESDRKQQAETLGATIAKKPGLVVAKLRTFLQGCEWLIAQWTMLKVILEAGESLSPSHVDLMDHLLGTSLMFRTRKGVIDNAEALAIVEGAIEGLEEDSLEGLRNLDEYDRLAAERGYLPETSREEKLNRRYENLATKRYEAATKELKAASSKAKASNVPAKAAPAVKVEQKARPIMPPPPAPFRNPVARNEPNGGLGKMTSSYVGICVGAAKGGQGSRR